MIAIQPTDALKAVRRERRARREGCYVVQDKLGQYLIVAQKLATIVSFLNSKVAVDAASRVSVTGLYEIVNASDDNRVCGFSKHRWKLTFAPLDDVGRRLERERGRFEHTLLLGPPECYLIEAIG